MRIAAYFIALTVLLGGCTHIRLFNPATPEGRAEVNARSEQRLAVVILASGERADAESLRLDVDEASWIDPGTGEARSAPLSNVLIVRVPNRGRGALEGLAIGAGVGTVLGILAATEGGPLSSLPLAWIGAGVFSGSAIGALVGVATGRTFYVPRHRSRIPLR